MKQVLYHIFHNPRCSKSREALKLLSVKTDDYKIIKYLEVEINKRDLTKIIEQLKISSNDILRKNEKTYKNLKLSNTNLTINEIVNLILTYPILLQRPIIAKYQNNNLVKTLIGRPPEKILSILD
ncbi:arsenate reductase (glutaredoxin) [Alphaproteobacteria bacterium]|nr:arsenate reductase (glutaredoxin) [Alphaproteobacteria bacterium]